MFSLVTFQSAGPTEALSALFTLERLLSRVSSHVILQITGLSEAPSALFTLVRLLPRVNPHVILQMAAHIEAPSALFTLERLLPRVRSHMSLQMAAHIETLSALFTLERLLSGVSSHVILQIAELSERFVAHFTFERSFSLMHNSDVLVQTVSPSESLSTHITHVRKLLHPLLHSLFIVLVSAAALVLLQFSLSPRAVPEVKDDSCHSWLQCFCHFVTRNNASEIFTSMSGRLKHLFQSANSFNW